MDWKSPEWKLLFLIKKFVLLLNLESIVNDDPGNLDENDPRQEHHDRDDEGLIFYLCSISFCLSFFFFLADTTVLPVVDGIFYGKQNGFL